MNRIRLRCVTTLFVTVWALLAGVANAQTVSPTTLELLLPDGATTIEPVSLTFDFACFAPIEVDVIASDTLPLVENLDGALVNNCSGDTSTFDMQFTGDGMDHDFELQFVDLANGRMLGTIPVTLSVPEPSSFVLLGFVAMILSRARRNRMRSRWPKA